MDSTDGSESHPYLMIIRARVIVPMEGEPIENGGVVVIGNEIAAVGPFEELKAGYSGQTLDLGEQVLLPGLINAHCHLDYTILRNRIPAQRSFTDWIRAINAAKAALSDEDYLASVAEGFAEAKSFGTTTLINLEAFPDLIPRMPRAPLRTWWCAEMIDVRKEVQVREVAEKLRGWFQSHPEWLGGFGLAPHAPYTASAQVFSDAAEVSRNYVIPFTTHLAESQEEMKMFRDGNGPLFDFMKDLGRPMDDCGKNTPLAHLVHTQPVKAHWLVAHLNEVTEADFRLLAEIPKFHIAHCPRSHGFFGRARFELGRLRSLGFNLCLGTDSLASNSDLSLFAEMREVIRMHASVGPREALAMATLNPARALGQERSLGKISPGSCADLIAFPCRGSGSALFEDIVAYEGKIPWMMVSGEPSNCP